MLLECRKAFGNWKRGDFHEVPDGCKYDRGHWRRIGPEPLKADVPYVVVEITPAEAAVIFRNRAPGEAPSETDVHVQLYRNLMNAGKWIDTGVIMFRSGLLLNGRHRMLALSGADAPQKFHVPEDRYPDFLVASERQN